MRYSALLAAAGAAWLWGTSAAPALGLQELYGIWRHPDNGSLVQIYPCKKSICAKVVRVNDPSRKDINNPNPALRNRSIVGIVIWQHGKETGPLLWSGSLYNTLDGRTYYGTVHLTGKTTLTLSGCYLRVMLCDHRTWTKAEPRIANAILSTVGAKHSPKAAAGPKSGAKNFKRSADRTVIRKASIWDWSLWR